MADALPMLRDLLQRSADYLSQRGVENARRESEWLFCHVLGLERIELYTRYDMLLDADQLARLRELVQRRGRREPLAYLLGSQPFCGLELTVSNAVLVPRPETEELVEQILADPELAADGLLVADIGCGSGAIALALAQARPAWTVHASDISPEALAVARQNAARHQLAVTFHAGDLHTALPPGPWDLLVANLPYVAESERAVCSPETAFEPQGALFADDEGMALIDRLLVALDGLLAPAGQAWFEHGFAQAQRLAASCDRLGLQHRCIQDAAGHERMTRVWR